MSKKFIAALVFIISLSLRVPGLMNSGLNNDELATVLWAKTPSVLQLYRDLMNPFEGNTLGYGLFMRFWAHFSVDESWFRLPSVIAGSLLPTAFFLALTRMWRTSIPWAFGASLVLSSSEFLVYYSQQARCYSFFSLAVFLAWWGAERAAQKNRWMLWVVAGSFSVWLHHFGILYVILLAALNSRSRPSLRWFGPIIAFTPHIPITWYQLQHGPDYLWGASKLLEVFASLFKWPPSILTGITLAILAAVGWYSHSRYRAALIVAVAAPLIASLASILHKPMLAERYFIPSLPLFFLGLGGIGGKWRAWMLIIAGIWLGWAVLGRNTSRRGVDFRETAAWLMEHEKECGSTVVTHPGLVTKWRYYLPERFVFLAWTEHSPPAPVWLATGHYGLPDFLEPLVKNSQLKRQGIGTIAACLKNQPIH